MKYKKSDLIAIIAIIGFILLLFLVPQNEGGMMTLAVLVIAAIVLTLLLKLFYFGRTPYVSSRKAKREAEKALKLENVAALSSAEKKQE